MALSNTVAAVMSISSSSVSYSSSTFTVSLFSDAVSSGGEESAPPPSPLTRWLRAPVSYKAVVTLAVVTSFVGTTVSSKVQGASLQGVLGVSVDGTFDSILRNEAATVGSTAFQTANLTSVYFSDVTVSSDISTDSSSKKSSDYEIPVTVPIGAVVVLGFLCLWYYQRKYNRYLGRQAQDPPPEHIQQIPGNVAPPLPDPVQARSVPPAPPILYREVF